MKVVYIAGQDPRKGPGGHASYVRAHARASIALGDEPHLFAIGSRAGVFPTPYGIVHIVRSPVPRRLFDSRMLDEPWPIGAKLWDIPSVARAVESFVRSHPDVRAIHGFTVWGYAGVAAARRLRDKGRRVLVLTSAYDTTVNESLAKFRAVRAAVGPLGRLAYAGQLAWAWAAVDRVERRAYVDADRVLVNYRCVSRLVTRSYGPGAEPIVVPYTCEPALTQCDAIDRRPSESGVPQIVCVSRHDSRKGVEVFIRAVLLLRRRGFDYRAKLVGAGLLVKPHRRLVSELGLADVVAVEGFVPDPGTYLAEADIYVLPSLEEGSGSLALLEAMRYGVAPVVSGCDGIVEDVDNGVSALVVRPGSVADLATALERLILDPDLRSRLGARARIRFDEDHSAARFIHALRDVYGGAPR